MGTMKCKACGSEFKFTEYSSTIFCKYCGTKQITPSLETYESRLKEQQLKEEKAKKQKRAILFSAIAAVVVTGLTLAYIFVLSPLLKYKEAESLYENKDYLEAVELYKELDDYKDSTMKILECYYNEAELLYNSEQYEKATIYYKQASGYSDSFSKIDDCNSALIGEEIYNSIKNARVGDYITLGTFEQDNNKSTKDEPLQWLVLAKENNELLLVTRYAIECRRYEEVNDYTSWAECSLREWLNSSFINDTFTDAERSLIITSYVEADNSNGFYSWQGEDTQDKVFLLSASEVKKYFSNESARRCKTTAYAKSKGAAVNGDGYVWWWMRNMGNVSYYASTVRADGKLSDGSDYLNYDTVLDATVRPAMRISLK